MFLNKIKSSLKSEMFFSKKNIKILTEKNMTRINYRADI